MAVPSCQAVSKRRVDSVAVAESRTRVWLNAAIFASTPTSYCSPSRRVEDLLAEIGRDPTCIFWG